MVPARQETSLLPDRSHPGLPDAVPDAQLTLPCRFPLPSADRRRYTHDHGCLHQCGHGTLQGPGRRQAALGTEDPRLLDADLPYRCRCRGRSRTSLCADQLVRYVQHSGRSGRCRAQREGSLLHRLRGPAALCALDSHQYLRVSSRAGEEEGEGRRLPGDIQGLRPHAQDHGAARSGPVLLLVRPLLHVGVHDTRRGRTLLQHRGPYLGRVRQCR